MSHRKLLTRIATVLGSVGLTIIVVFGGIAFALTMNTPTEASCAK